MDNVRDEMANNRGKRKRVESALLSRCVFRSVRFLEVKIRCKHALVPRIVFAVRSLEVFASRRLPRYYRYGIFNVTRTLSALGSVSASRSVRSERFDCSILSHSNQEVSKVSRTSKSYLLRAEVEMPPVAVPKCVGLVSGTWCSTEKMVKLGGTSPPAEFEQTCLGPVVIANRFPLI